MIIMVILCIVALYFIGKGLWYFAGSFALLFLSFVSVFLHVIFWGIQKFMLWSGHRKHVSSIDYWKNDVDAFLNKFKEDSASSSDDKEHLSS